MKGMFSMSFTTKRAKRITAACASVAVLTAGGVVAAGMASASGTLTLSTSSPVTALNLGAQITKRVTTLTASGGTAGAWTLSYAGGTAINFNAADTAATVQTALNLDAGIAAAGGVTVTGNPLNANTNALTITFKVPGVRDTFVATPTTNAITVANSTTGGALAAPLANATFGTKISTTPVGVVKLSLDSYTAPTGATVTGVPSLQYQLQGSGSATGPTSGWIGLANAGATGSVSAAISTPATNDVFLAATEPGTYTFHFVDDFGTAGTGDDAISPTVTLTVRDAYAATTETVDDWAPAVSNNPTASAIGAPVTATVDLTGLSLVDTRNSSSGVGVLGSKIAALVGVGFSGQGAVDAAGTAVTLGATGATRRLATGVTNAAGGNMTSTVYFDRNGNGTISDVALTTAATSITSNTVTGVALAAGTGQTANVTGTGAATKLRPGVDTITFTATATKAAGATPVAGATVWFTLGAGSGTALTDLTANGAAVPSSGDVSVVTDANGVATLTVKSTKTASTNAYTVDASSNGNAGTQITATYTAPAATTVKTGGNIANTVGGSVTITGELVDQWGKAFTPAGGGQATLNVDQTANSYSSADYTRSADIVDGKFSYTYPDVTANTTARTDAYRWTAGGVNGSGNDTVKWLASTTVGTASLTSLAGNTFPLSASVAVTTKAAPAGQRKALVGVLKDDSGSALPFTSFTLTGTPGVYFENADGAYVTSLTARTSSSGALQVAADQSGSDVKVLLTKPGTATITLTAGSKSATADVTVDAQLAADAYTVTVTNATGIAGKNVTVGGKVTDAFGNPVPGAQVNLALPGGTFGAFLTSATPLTDSNGNYSAIFTSGDTDKGTVTYTATINGQVANATANAGWATGGLTLADGTYKATGSIAVAANEVTISAPASRVGAGSVTLSGVAAPGAAVDVYRKTSSGLSLVDSVTANATTGAWSAKVSISRNSVFLAKTSSATSLQITVKVISTAKIKAKAMKGGVVKLTVTGGPSKKGTIKVWITKGGKTTKLSRAVTGGIKTWALKPGKGVTKFKATYTASGCQVSSMVKTSVKL